MNEELKSTQIVYGENVLMMQIDDCLIFGNKDALRSLAEKLIKLPSAEPGQRWIPMTERFPKKENKSYWICTNTKHQYQCRWTNNIYGIGKSNNWGWSIFDIPQYTRVLAWMPLPEPWKGNDGLA